MNRRNFLFEHKSVSAAACAAKTHSVLVGSHYIQAFSYIARNSSEKHLSFAAVFSISQYHFTVRNLRIHLPKGHSNQKSHYSPAFALSCSSNSFTSRALFLIRSLAVLLVNTLEIQRAASSNLPVRRHKSATR